MFGGLTIQAVFLVVIGAALLVTGTSGLRRSIRMKKQKAQRTGKILRISHVEKRDEEGFLIQNYYETRIEYVEMVTVSRPLSRVWMSFRKGKKSGSSRTMSGADSCGL